eukprot:11184836-Lingulodinium_polyedra.AAC.1
MEGFQQKPLVRICWPRQATVKNTQCDPQVCAPLTTFARISRNRLQQRSPCAPVNRVNVVASATASFSNATRA